MTDADGVADWRLEDLREGMRADLDVTVTDEDIDAFAALSGDVSPLHMDRSFAKGRGFPGRVAHGVLISGYVSRLLGVSLPGRNCLLQSLNLRYLKAVCAGDTIRVGIVLTQISHAVRTLVLEVAVQDASSGEMLARGKAQVGLTEEVGQHG